MDELTLLAELAPEQGTVPRAKYTEEEIRGEATFVEITRDTPAGDTLGSTDLADEVSATDTALGRFLVSRDINEGPASKAPEPTFSGGKDFFRRHAAA